MTVKKVFGRPESLCDVPNLYCSGCGHGVAHRLVAEAIDHFGLRDRTVAVAPAGCSVLLYDYFDVDSIESAHGRALAVGTGIKRANPDLFVFTYQGDGDLASIGMCETIHTANRGENLTAIFINNAVYGMTGGQMAPTTLLGQTTTTTPNGRCAEMEGAPMKMAEMMATFDGVVYSERVALYDPRQTIRARKAVFKAFEAQINNEGFGFVEILAACTTNLKMTPERAQQWLVDDLCETFPLGVYKDVMSGAKQESVASRESVGATAGSGSVKHAD
ncbi:MAG: 2-oxoglutarate oxidoreductase [Candidatus Hydrogenedentes bacterium]|nr:2-oxoglutarate oxidoreductase [Candidatus Hydrogenedentota bacterium]